MSNVELAEKLRKMAADAVFALGVNRGQANEKDLTRLLSAAANLALEEAEKVILMDACDNPTCDIPWHEKARTKADEIAKLRVK